MANTYLQIYLHFVFAVQGRIDLIPKRHQEELYKYMTGIVTNKKQKLLAVGGMPDHVHILIGYHPSQPLPNLLRDIKANTSKFINDNRWVPGKFQWQEGYGAFSYNHSQISNVIQYIDKQEEHHGKAQFKDEYIKLLEQYEIEYNSEYLFDWL